MSAPEPDGAALRAAPTRSEALRDRVSYGRHPSRSMAISLAALIAVGTLLLRLPAAAPGTGTTPLRTALFTATSASTVTGLNIADPGSSWTPFGQVVILLLIQIGGIGVMSSASLVAVLVAARMGLRSRLVGEYETRAVGISTVRRVIGGTVAVSAITELVVAVLLTTRLRTEYDYTFGRAVWFGTFHAVSAFNNAGFTLWRDNLMTFATDPFVLVPLMIAFIVGGLGLLVVFELAFVRPARGWTVHTKTTLTVTAVLLVIGPLVLIACEWGNPRTLGALDVPGRILAGLFSGVSPRTAGFHTIDYGEAGTGSLLFTDALMFIGGGSGSTAGGIKVTTFAVLIMAVVAEARGDRDVDIFRRRMSGTTVRQAIAVVALGMGSVLTAVMIMSSITDLPLDDLLLETTSALCTVGLSTGITPSLPATGQYLLVTLMYLGRIGSIALVTTLAMHNARRSYRNPEGRPIVG